MFRVTKKDGHFCIITHGDPQTRISFYLEALPMYSYELRCEKISLSFMSNFINLLRSNSKQGTMEDALKDKKVLSTSLIDGIIC
jgi:hypothetical protein